MNELRKQTRYHKLRALGWTRKQALTAMGSASKFLAAIMRMGLNPDDYGDLCVKLPSGAKPKPEIPTRNKRYRMLVLSGVPALQASRLSQSWRNTLNELEARKATRRG